MIFRPIGAVSEYRISTRPSYHIAAYSFTHGQARGTMPFGLLDEIHDTDKEQLNKILNDILEITNNPSLRERAMEIIRRQK
jgi:hypothetical protein